ncbi:hypothetical protein [Sulfuracidifex tepidarius]|uniref:UPF0282 protein IC006_2049 n=1 Tax=Sulfuracidifex tepidarius TaxID=1294262 RepID=A0A510E4P2_9CREN|nr:hypothetical protein [Sulfuracidifex tepidarius]BBG24715.1 hypothetical protein IC006_2049 [Sulfuracidifex tepidarius]BBG27503.1 hypothetical protein IC007_2057 [Sulfuracidifex tepidarius]
MKIVPIAFESLGVRSQATFLETPDLKILVDPAVSLAPRRYGLPPHKLEVEKLLELARSVKEYAEEADVLIITHYHYDHHDPGFVIPRDIYKGKKVFIKDPNSFINASQGKGRAPRFLNSIKGLPDSVQPADGKEVVLGHTKIRFSCPVLHGADEKMGYVIQVAVSDGDETVMFTSDIEGAPKEMHVKFTQEVKPSTLIIDGPLSYMLGYALTEEQFNAAMNNLEKIVKQGLTTMIVDHHLVRDQRYREIISSLKSKVKEVNANVVTAAEYLGREENPLESRRKELFSESNEPAKLPRGVAELLKGGG